MQAGFDLIGSLQKIVGLTGVISEGDRSAYFVDARNWMTGSALVVVLPRSTDEVSQVVRLAAEQGLKVMPQGGNTSMSFGSTPMAPEDGILINLSRMNALREMDREGSTAIVEAGCILASLHAAAEEVDRSFPLRLGSEGSAQIGGLIAANAGGTSAVRYGVMRDLVLGVEVVLPNGDVVSDLAGLRKDNRGYDLNHLFVGAEGTLGIVTAAALKLYPVNRVSAAALVAVETPSVALELLGRVQDAFGTSVQAFELLSGNQIELCEEFADVPCPFEALPDWAVLIEVADPDPEAPLYDRLETLLGEAFEAGLLVDALVAQNMAQSEKFWLLRHAVTEANVRAGYSTTTDASVRIRAVPGYIEEASAVLTEKFPEAMPMVVAHLGDGNVHFIAQFRTDRMPEGFDTKKTATAVQSVMNEIVVKHGGSFSAEHGIGRKLTGELARLSDPVRYAALLAIKRAFDPANMMNPGVLFPEDAV